MHEKANLRGFGVTVGGGALPPQMKVFARMIDLSLDSSFSGRWIRHVLPELKVRAPGHAWISVLSSDDSAPPLSSAMSALMRVMRRVSMLS